MLAQGLLLAVQPRHHCRAKTTLAVHIALLEVKERNDELARIYVQRFSTFIQKTAGCRARLGPPASRSRQKHKIYDSFCTSAQAQTGVLLLPRVFHAWIGRNRPDRRVPLFRDTVSTAYLINKLTLYINY